MNLQQEVTEKLKDKGGMIAWHSDELTASQKNELPAEWLSTIGTHNLPDKLEQLWKPWLSFTQDQPEAFALLQQSLHGLAICIDQNGLPCLLYIFRFKSGRLCFMMGYLPQKEIFPAFNSWWSSAPASVRTFYEQVHNGWISPYSKDGGPLPAASIATIDLKYFDLPAEFANQLPAAPEYCFQWYRYGNYTLVLGVKEGNTIPFLFSPKHRFVDTEVSLEEVWNDQLMMLAEELKVRDE